MSNKKRILLLSDDLRMTSGVGTVSKNFVMGTMKHYEWVQIGGTPVVLDNENDAITFFTAPNEIDIISFSKIYQS